MTILTGLMRLGRDAELRATSGDSVATLSLAYNYGKKENGKQPTTWVEATLWGKRAESLAPHLTKGKLLSVVLTDIHVKTWESKDGKRGASLCGKVSDLEFAGGTTTASKPAQVQEKSFEDQTFENDDIPF